MGMIAIYLRVSEDCLEDYLKDSGLLAQDMNNYNTGLNIKDLDLIDIDKSWAGLFYLLTGEFADTPEDADLPLRWLVRPPQDIDSKQDLGYGPASYTTAEQTKEVSIALNSISEDTLISRWDVELMNEMSVYPFEEGEWNQEGLEYLLQGFRQLKKFYEKASKENQEVIFLFN